MNLLRRFSDYLERRWVAPAYIGWVLLGLAVFFFAAATNTLAGWLYVMSGVLLALLAIAAVLPPRNLGGLQVERQPIRPVAAGEVLFVELTLKNLQRQPRGLFQAIDWVPETLGTPQTIALRTIPPGQSYLWSYQLPTQHRGHYHWPGGMLRSAAPLGLFWSRRRFDAPASVVVYPTTLPLKRCPIIDALGTQGGRQWQQSRAAEASTEGITRSLRPYRWGDPTRLIHWRTSARYGELRVRELEKTSSGQEVLVALDQHSTWSTEGFEQAVITAASLYTYALKRGVTAKVWARDWGVLHDYPRVMSALAAVQPIRTAESAQEPPQLPLVWLTAGDNQQQLPPGSRRCCWSDSEARTPYPTLWVNSEQPLQPQLQKLPS